MDNPTQKSERQLDLSDLARRVRSCIGLLRNENVGPKPLPNLDDLEAAAQGLELAAEELARAVPQT